MCQWEKNLKMEVMLPSELNSLGLWVALNITTSCSLVFENNFQNRVEREPRDKAIILPGTRTQSYLLSLFSVL
jgi:hypothetical protein